MSAPKSGKEVAVGMERYSVRRGDNPLPRETNALNPIHCFDRGHHRVLSRDLLQNQNIQFDMEGDFVTLRGRRIEMGAMSPLGVRLPVGFVAVPTQTILQHFSTTYALNIRQMEAKLAAHHRDFGVFLRQRLAGTDLGRPRRPTLNLQTPSEFEQFLFPLKSFYFTRLKLAFHRLVKEAEDGQRTVFTNMNVLALPNLVRGAPSDAAAEARWAGAVGEYIAVRIPDFDSLIPSAPQYPIPQLPFPNQPIVPYVPAPGAPPPALTPRQIDEKTFASRKWWCFIYMEPWMDASRTPNPFVSPEFRQAFIVAQNGFVQRHAEFKQTMDRKRRVHAQKWRDYAAYRNEMKSVFMLDTARRPVNQFAERPQVEHFTKEWKHFAFGLKEEMKNYEFVPIAVPPAGAPPGFVPFYAGFAPAQPFADISQSVLQAAQRMFLI